jgi:AraC-like DNA-binding protein
MIDLWSVQLYHYEAEFNVAGSRVTVRPGDVSVVPPGVPFSYRYRGPSTHLYAHLRLPPSDRSEQIPAVQGLGIASGPTAAAWEAAIASFRTSPQHCQAQLWSLLWHLATLGRESTGCQDLHPVLRSAIGYIEVHLGDAILVPTVAREVGVSHGHLTRLFRSELHCTVVAYIRRRRLERAARLLQHSDLPVKTIAEDVGIPDLQAFNKDVRKEFGRSPRALRVQVAPSRGRIPAGG